MGDLAPPADGDFGNLLVRGKSELIANEISGDHSPHALTVSTKSPMNPDPDQVKWTVSVSPNLKVNKLKWKPMEEALSSTLSPSHEVISKTDIQFSDAALKKLMSDSDHAVRRDSRSKERPGSPRSSKSSRSSRSPMTRKRHMTSDQLGKQSKKTSVETSKRRKMMKEEDVKRSELSGESTPRPIKGVCLLCGVESADGTKSVCKSCMNCYKKDKSKQQGIGKAAATAIKIVKLNESSQANTEEEVNLVHSGRSTFFDSQDKQKKMEAVDMKNPAQNRTDTDLSPKRTNSVDAKTLPVFTPKAENLLSNTVSSAVSKVAEDFSLKQKIDNSTIDKNDPGTKSGGVIKCSMKRSTTDSEIVGKGISNGCDSKTIEELKSLGFDSSKKKYPPVTKPCIRKRESSDPTLVSDRNTTSSENVSEGSSKIASFKLERSKTTFGKFNYDRDRKLVTESEKTQAESSVVPSEHDKTMLYAELKSKKFPNLNRAQTIIGDGNTKRQKPKLDVPKLKSDKKEPSFSCGAKEKTKVDVPRDEPTNDKKDKNVKDARKEPAQADMPKTLYNYNRSEEDVFISDSEDDSQSVAENEYVIELPTVLPDNEDVETLETTNSETETSCVRHSRTSLTEDKNTAQLISRLSQYDRYGVEVDDDNAHDSIDSESDNAIKYGAREMDEQVSHLGEDENADIAHAEPLPTTLNKIEEESESESLVSEGDWYFDGELKGSPSVADKITISDVEDGQCKEIESHYQSSGITHYSTEHNEEQNMIIEDYTSPVNDYSNEVVEPKAVAVWSESSYTEMVEQRPREQGELYTYETDVDTGLAVDLTQQEEEEGYTPRSTDPWGLPCASNSDSSVESNQEEKVHSSHSSSAEDYYTEYKSKANDEIDDLVYFDDKSGRELTDSDLYTGGIFNVLAQVEGNDQRDMTKNNSTTPHEQHPHDQWSNFWNISSRPQMQPLDRRPRMRSETEKNADLICSAWMEGQCQKECNVITNDSIWLSCDVSNNYNSFEDDEEENDKPATSSITLENPNPSEYTEFNNERFWARICDMKPPKKDLNFYESKDFSKYDRPQPRQIHTEEGSSFSRVACLNDVPFFGEEPKSTPQLTAASAEQSVYFNTPHLLSSKPRYPEMPKDEDYQGGWFSASKIEASNLNNNAGDGENESYTGCFKNEEELKPTHEGLFNRKASNFVFQKRTMNSMPTYCRGEERKGQSEHDFVRGSVDFTKPETTSMNYYFQDTSKSYYDKEDSTVYAFEEVKRQAEEPRHKLPQVFKIGGITVRNNVEREVDYARNIDMDLQEAPKPWVRYDISTNTKEIDTSSYAQNVSYDNLTGYKPWAVDQLGRQSWRESKVEEETKKPKDDPSRTWTGAPTKVVKSVKSLGTYVRRWF